MFYVKYDGEYVLDLIISSWVDGDGVEYSDNYILTDEKNYYAEKFETEDEALKFIRDILECVDYISKDKLIVVEYGVYY